jgi:hypothetical protein
MKLNRYISPIMLLLISFGLSHGVGWHSISECGHKSCCQTYSIATPDWHAHQDDDCHGCPIPIHIPVNVHIDIAYTYASEYTLDKNDFSLPQITTLLLEHWDFLPVISTKSESTYQKIPPELPFCINLPGRSPPTFIA